MSEAIGRAHFHAKRPLSSCQTKEERKGWILAQHEATEARKAERREAFKAASAKGGVNARGKPRKKPERVPSWFLEEMADNLDEEAA